MLRTAIVFIVFLISSLSANTAILDLGKITRDTDTGLNWLDVSESSGLSHNEVLGLMSSGERFSGYRHAKLIEVQQLFVNAGITGFINGDNDFNYIPVKDLAHLLFEASYDFNGVTGLTAFEPDSVFGESSAYVSLVFIDSNMTGSTGIGYTTYRDFSMPGFGHFLVAPVPIPAAAWLFGSALVGLIGMKRQLRK